ncbi:hypothetical protein [Polycyclovorans algicola]|uniref:hypothetical protein n=1 Tax=Polycyclovorans algicola TaxID=616992 RepID=UPI0004A6C5B4|nr:hypothetical protein [Polycyclovorans algicola]
MTNHALLSRFSVFALLGVVIGLAACGGGGGGATSTPEPPLTGGDFNVRTEAAARFVRVDRMGQPAVGTALLSRAPGSRPGDDNQRDALNRADPADDTTFIPEMLATLTTLLQQLGPALRVAGLTPCSTGEGSSIVIDKCVSQVAPIIVPDVVTFDLDRPTGWPNGRGFDDPVVDRLLSFALLDLDVHPLDALFELPLNPPGNEGDRDDQSPTTFPYLRPAFPEPSPPPPAPG